MIRYLLMAVYISIWGLIFTGGAIADDRDSNHDDRGAKRFVGLWQAIDSFDGSTQFLSITCSGKHSCDVRLNDTAFTLSCPGQIGFAQGEGMIKRNTLNVTLTLSCSNLNGTSTEAGSQENQFVFDKNNKILININDDPSPSNIFHKISQ